MADCCWGSDIDYLHVKHYYTRVEWHGIMTTLTIKDDEPTGSDEEYCKQLDGPVQQAPRGTVRKPAVHLRTNTERLVTHV
jgi:hypothetical protein